MKKPLVFTLFILLFYHSSYAGLIIEIDPNIVVQNIKQLNSTDGNLIVKHAGITKTIQLEEGVLASIVLWVNQNATGPFVFSYDSALVPGAGKYASASLPKGLSDAMFNYDVYAHSLAQGGVSRSNIHPLEAIDEADNLMPDKQYQQLMSLDNYSANALRYQDAMFRHLNRPSTCVGEFTIRAIAAQDDFPVKIEVESFRTLRSEKWHRPTDVFSPLDREIFSLPYLPLKKDIESRWEKYRDAFPPLEELSSIVEAYAILEAIKNRKQALWLSFLNQLFPNNKKQLPVHLNYSSTPSLSTYQQDWELLYSWTDRCEQIIGQNIETIEEAHTALALIWNDSDYLYSRYKYNWYNQLEEIAKVNDEIAAKFLLIKAKEEIYEEEIKCQEYFSAFFKATKNSMVFFRLRVKGIKLLEEYIDYVDADRAMWMEKKYHQEIKSLFSDFIDVVNEQCGKDALTASHQLDLIKWENLSQDVYSTDLLSIAKSYYGYRLPSEFVQTVACIHFNRGRTFQKGRTIAYRHAHFRFLKYLLANSWEEEQLANLVAEYRTALAQVMGITEWEEYRNRFNYIKYNNIYSPNYLNKENNWLDALTLITGKLVAVSDLKTKKFSRQSALQSFKKGRLGGVVNEENQFTLLLLNSETLEDLLSKQGYRSIRIYGIPYDEGRCIQPVRIEYLNKKSWQVFDFAPITALH